MEPRQPGAFVKNGDKVTPDLNDEAMKARQKQSASETVKKREVNHAEK